MREKHRLRVFENKVLRKIFGVVVYYLTTGMYYSYGKRPSPSVEGWYMLQMKYGGHMITGDECGPNVLTFAYGWGKIPWKISTRKLTRPGSNSGRCVRGNDVTSRPQRWSKIFGAKRDDIIGERRKLHTVEQHALYSSSNIIRNLKSRLRWAGHVARMEQFRNTYWVLVG